MNPQTAAIVNLVNFKSAVRDTLEYALKRDTHSVQAYENKKKIILNEFNARTVLHNTIDNSGEAGEKLKEMIQKLIDEIYGENSTIVRAADDGLRVDVAQAIAIFEAVIPVHENVEMMVQSLIRDCRAKNIDVSEGITLDKAEERFYRSVALLTLSDRLMALFNDYNAAMNEAKGQPNPSANFISADIGHVARSLRTIRDMGRVTDVRYKDVEDHVFRVLDYMTGKRDMPAGSNWRTVMQQLTDSLNALLRESQDAYGAAFQPVWKEYVEEARRQREAAGKPAAEPVETEGEPSEIDPATGLPKA